MQRYRTIIHMVDEIIDNGHELFLCVSDKNVKIRSYRNTPCNISASAPNTIEYLEFNYGLKIKNKEKIKYTRKKKLDVDLYLAYANSAREKKLPNNTICLPYTGWSCITPRGLIETGNPLCEEIKVSSYKEIRKSVLIMHPGGGRGHISPSKSIRYDKNKVVRNNIDFLQTVLDNIGFAENVTIKPHPAPFTRCSKGALEEHVVPNLKFNGGISVVADNLIKLIKEHEYILNFGGTTAFWLMGSQKKWANVTGLARFDSNREALMDKRGGSVYYKEIKNIQPRCIESEIKRFNLPAKANIMKVINEALHNN